jgi:hypothetical protein
MAMRGKVLIACTLLAGLVMVAGCGGSGAGSTTEGNASPTGAGAATQAPGPGGGGGAAGSTLNACQLLTAAEVQAATGQPNVAAEPTASGNFEGASQCAFISNGILPVTIVTVTGPNTNTDVNSYLALPLTVLVNLNGAAGAWMPAAGYVLMVIKHDVAVAVGPVSPVEGKDPQAVATELGQKIADRMP